MRNASEHMEQGMVAHLELLYTVARKLTRDATTAQQLTEHTLSNALHSQEEGEDTQDLKPYLLTTMRHTYIQHYQNGHKRPASVA